MTRWWSKKYRLPTNHNLLLESTVLDLLAEFFEDKFEEDPAALREFADGGKYITGDQLVDHWFDQLANGESVDLWSAFSEESKADVKNRLAKLDSKKSTKRMTFGDTHKMVTKQQQILHSGDLPLTFGNNDG